MAKNFSIIKPTAIPAEDTLDNWIKLDPVIPLGIVAKVHGGGVPTPRYKKGNGTTKFSELPWFDPESGDGFPNSEIRITACGTFIAPVTGWYYIWMIGGGASGGSFNWYTNLHQVQGGNSGGVTDGFIYLEAGQSVNVTIGAGGVPTTVSTGVNSGSGGVTSFGSLSTNGARRIMGSFDWTDNDTCTKAFGGSQGNGSALLYAQSSQPNANDAVWYGAGGGAAWAKSTGYNCGRGMAGVVRLFYRDPVKVAGPESAVVLFSTRRMAPRAVTEPVTINLYDPETGQGSVWREEDVKAKLAEGYITEEAWKEICEQKAAEDHEAWLNDPETEEERFQLLQQACAVKLTETDICTQPDYPISEETRQAIYQYRKVIRELNHQEGAPWDGGGELTPWPELPVINKIQTT